MGFNGNGSFVTNHYVIFNKALVDDEKHAPNVWAIAKGYEGMATLLSPNMSAANSSYNIFINYLQKIYQKEKDNEVRYLNFKLNQLKQNGAIEIANKLQTAINDNNLSSAFMLVTYSQEELKSLLEKTKIPTARQTSEFWDRQFNNYIKKIFEDNIIEQNGLYVGNINMNQSLENIVDGYIKHIVDNSQGNVFLQNSLDIYKQQYIDEFGQRLEKLGIFPKSWNKNTKLFVNGKNNARNFTKQFKIKKKNAKDKDRAIGAIAQDLFNGIARGMAGELNSLSLQSRRSNGITISTATSRKTLANNSSVQIKADTTSFELASLTTEIQIPNMQSLIDNGQIAQNYEEVRQEIIKLNESLGEIFEVQENVKEYTSNRDLQIEGSGSFKNRAQNLINIAQSIDMPVEKSFDKLVFLLNNTVQGCIADNQIDKIQDYIAAICVAWLWDDYTQMLNLKSGNGSTTKIRLFNTGGFYYSSSEIIKQTLENLQSNFRPSDNVNKFVSVDIIPPTYSAEQYMGLVNSFPIDDIPKSEVGAWMSQLQKRWDSVRGYVESSGQVAIHFKQTQLSQLLDSLYSYI